MDRYLKIRCDGWWLILLSVVLVGCENGATSFMLDSNQHAIILVREQPYFWSDDVNQFIVASRLPDCQRKVKIHPGKEKLTPVDVYEVDARLWALRQGQQWYLVGTDKCLVQDWKDVDPEVLGPWQGRFAQKNEKIEFQTAPG